MKISHDPAIEMALVFEAATLDALRAIEGMDREVQRFACVVMTMKALPVEDFDRIGIFIALRGRILYNSAHKIVVALETFAAGGDTVSASRRVLH